MVMSFQSGDELAASVWRGIEARSHECERCTHECVRHERPAAARIGCPTVARLESVRLEFI